MNFVVGPMLGILALIDIKKKKIPVRPVLFLGVVLLILRVWEGVTVGEFVCGLLPGTLLLLVAWVTKEKLGAGDGILVFCLGMGYGIEFMMTMTGAAFAVAAVASMILMVAKKANRRTELPFLPFLFCGWVIGVFL